jgi:hypothetical protein
MPSRRPTLTEVVAFTSAVALLLSNLGNIGDGAGNLASGITSLPGPLHRSEPGEREFVLRPGVGSRIIADLGATAKVTAFYSEGDGLQHAVTASRDGTLTEFWFGGFNQGSGSRVLMSIAGPGVARIGGYYSAPDATNHVVVLDRDDELLDIRFAPLRGKAVQVQLGKRDVRVIGLAALYSPPDNTHRVILLERRKTTELTELEFNAGGEQVGERSLGEVPGAIDIAAYYSSAERRVHAVVLYDDGHIVDHWSAFDGPEAGSRELVPKKSGIGPGLAAFESTEDGSNVLVYANDDGELYRQRSVSDRPPPEAQLLGKGPLAGFLAGYYFPGDELRHVVLSDVRGRLFELWYRN